jgi:hypothetical protein
LEVEFTKEPGEVGYAEAALSNANLVGSSGSTLSAGKLFAPAITVQNTGHTWFSFASANIDRLDHFHGFGPNAYGIEDQKGGRDRDFDDFITRYSLSI